MKAWQVAAAATAFSVGVAAGMLMSPLTPGTDSRAAGGTARPSLGEAPADATADEDTDGCVPAPLAERAGAVLVVGLPGTTAVPASDDGDPSEALAAAELVGVAGVFLTGENIVDHTQASALIDDLRTRLGRGLLVAADEETGRVSSFRPVIGATSSPRTTAARTEVDQWRDDAAEVAEELAGLGVDWNFAPVADLDDGPHQQVIGDRSYSADPAVAARYALAFAEGHERAGVVPTFKHFPGHGGPAADPHREPVTDDTPRAELRQEDLRPFATAIRRGARAVMVGQVRYDAFDPDRPASLSPDVYDLLRDELGFAGVAVTDSIGMGAVHQQWGYEVAAPMALRAGADAVLATDGRAAPDMAAGIVDAVEAGELDESRLDEAATRVLALAGRDPEPVTCRPVPEDFPTGTRPAVPADRR